MLGGEARSRPLLAVQAVLGLGRVEGAEPRVCAPSFPGDVSAFLLGLEQQVSLGFEGLGGPDRVEH